VVSRPSAAFVVAAATATTHHITAICLADHVTATWACLRLYKGPDQLGFIAIIHLVSKFFVILRTRLLVVPFCAPVVAA